MDPNFVYSGNHMLLLSDEVLLMILKHLSAEDLLNVGKTSTRLRNICHEAKLWKKIEISDRYDRLEPIMNTFLSQHTRDLRIESKVHGENRGYRSSFSSSLLARLCPYLNNEDENRCIDHLTNLTDLSLIQLKFGKEFFKIQYLPATLRTLDLTGTMIDEVTEQTRYFRDVSQSLPNLKSLNLSHCSWVLDHSLMALSKLPSLQCLYLRGCRNIGNCVAYSSLAFRFGFKSLRVLDATNSNFGVVEVQAASMLASLEEFCIGEYDQFRYDGDGDEIRDMHLVSFSRHENIRMLDLSGHNITDKILPSLIGIKSLRRIDAYFTNISPAAAESFMSTRTNCVINIVIPLTCEEKL